MDRFRSWTTSRVTWGLLAAGLLLDLLLMPTLAGGIARLPATLAHHQPPGWPGPLGAWRVLVADPAVARLWQVLALAVLGGLGWLTWQAATPAPEATAFGSARWRDPASYPKTLARWRAGRADNPAGLVVGADPLRGPVRTAWVTAQDGHALLLGAPGAGKSTLCIMPTLAVLAQRGESVLVTDPKGELFAATAGLFQAAGYQVARLDFREPARSDRVNPLTPVARRLAAGDTAGATQQARQIAQILAAQGQTGGEHSAFFAQSTQALVTSLILAVLDRAPEAARHLASVYHTLIHTADLDAWFATFPPEHPASQAYGVVRLSPPETRQNQLTVAANALGLFSDPAVAWLTAQDTVDLARFAEGRQAVFLVVPDDSSVYYPLVGVVVAELLQLLSQAAAREPDQRLKRPVHLVLDEFGNLPALPDFDKALAVARGKGVRITIALQTLAQLDARYGRETAQGMRNSCNTWVYLSSNDPDTARVVSEKTGQATIQTTSLGRSWGSSGGRNTTVSRTGRALLTADEVLRWPWGQALLLQAGQLPARLPLRRFPDWPFPPLPAPDRPARPVTTPALWRPPEAAPAAAPPAAAEYGIGF
ncbi:MAG: type IV secretory system conjugative DNA transfer family protein [Firmicutes bacterium]|nr:type IV secretory system conjugative DNA transfer family protein [Bacillota bacterium]